MTAHIAEAVPLDVAVKNGMAATSHKYGADTPLWVPAGTRTASGELYMPNDGACLVVDGIAATVRDPYWRKEKGNRFITTADLMVLHGINNSPSADNYPHVGTEGEAFALGRNRDTTDVSDPDDKNPELYRFMREFATKPTTNLYEAGILHYQGYMGLLQHFRERAARLYPGSNVAHRVMTVEDINPNEYVGRIAEYMGIDEAIRYYDSGSFQPTVGEMYPYEQTVHSKNLFMSSFAPLMARFSASSFAAQGQLRPRYPSPNHNVRPQNGFLQTRGLGRRTGSPEGSVSEPLPPNREAFLQHTDHRMRVDRIPGPGRAITLHGDLRYRPEHSPAGATEACPFDTNGGHIQSNMAFANFMRAYNYAIPKAEQTGEIEAIAKAHPRVIKAGAVTDTDLAVANSNSILMTQDIPDIKIQALDGTQASPQGLWDESLDVIAKMVKGTPFELDSETMRWLRLRGQTPTREDMPAGQDGMIDIGAFYRGGRGTLAHYQKALANQLVGVGFTESNAIAEVQMRTADAFEQYLLKFNPEEQLAFLKDKNT